jgi:hypothetical protein
VSTYDHKRVDAGYNLAFALCLVVCLGLAVAIIGLALQ